MKFIQRTELSINALFNEGNVKGCRCSLRVSALSGTVPHDATKYFKIKISFNLAPTLLINFLIKTLGRDWIEKGFFHCENI